MLFLIFSHMYNVTMLDVHVKSGRRVMRLTYVEVIPVSKKHWLQTALNAQFPKVFSTFSLSRRQLMTDFFIWSFSPRTARQFTAPLH